MSDIEDHTSFEYGSIPNTALMCVHILKEKTYKLTTLVWSSLDDDLDSNCQTLVVTSFALV